MMILTNSYSLFMFVYVALKNSLEKQISNAGRNQRNSHSRASSWALGLWWKVLKEVWVHFVWYENSLSRRNWSFLIALQETLSKLKAQLDFSLKLLIFLKKVKKASFEKQTFSEFSKARLSTWKNFELSSLSLK